MAIRASHHVSSARLDVEENEKHFVLSGQGLIGPTCFSSGVLKWRIISSWVIESNLSVVIHRKFCSLRRKIKKPLNSMRSFPFFLLPMAMGCLRRAGVEGFSARILSAWATRCSSRRVRKTSGAMFYPRGKGYKRESGAQIFGPSSFHNVYVASSGSQIFPSHDSGSSWSRPSTRLYSTSEVSSATSSTGQQSLILEGLNPSQIEAVTQHPRAVTRVIAGPGSGKTKVLTCRVVHLLNQEPRSRVLAVTFTKKASEEMRQRVELLLMQQMQQQQTTSSMSTHSSGDHDGIINEDFAPNVPKDLGRVTMGTFHSICAKILRFNGDLLENLPSIEQDMVGRGEDGAVNLDGNFAILDAGDQLRILKECMDECEIDLKKTSVKPVQVLTGIGTIKEAYAQGNDPFAEYNDNKNKKPLPKPLKIAKEVYGLYREKLLSNNALDFDDLIFMTREMLMMYPVLRERLHQRWPHLLVDEFQDTSIIQMDLVKLLTSRSLFVVGDADQSIYSWRGAHAGSLSDFRTEFDGFAEDGVQTVFLKENYRSTSNIVSAAEKVISSSGKSSKGQDDELRKAMQPKRGSGPPPRVVACADERAEAKFVVDTITEMIADSSLGPESTVAIIYRTNAQSRYLEEACVQKNIPYVIRGGAGGFYKRAEVKDCLCFLRWLYNGNDESAMLRAFKTPSRGLGDKAINTFKEYYAAVDKFYRESLPGTPRPSRLDVLTSLASEQGKGIQLAQGVPEPSEWIAKRALNNFLPFAAQMHMIREKAYNSPVDSLLFSVIEEFELMSHFDSISKSKTEFQERRENVQELRQATKRYSGRDRQALFTRAPGGSDADFFDEQESPLGNFLDDVALVSDIKAEDAESGDSRLVVNLMTIHASKGTEFDAVFVVGNEEGTLPSSMSMQEGEDSIAMEEEKRLCYVAMTRAKTRLILTWRKEVTMFSNWSEDGPKASSKERSRFLDALVKKKGGQAKATNSNPQRPNDRFEIPRRTNASSAVSPPRQARSPPANNSKQYSSTPSTRAPVNTSTRTGPIPRQRTASPPPRQARSPPLSTPQRYSSTHSTTVPVSRQRTQPKSSPQPETSPRSSKPFDSTLFYPVGSDVIHNNFGKGVVLQPPPPTDSTKLLVRVKFDNGRTMEFPADGHDLVPVF